MHAILDAIEFSVSTYNPHEAIANIVENSDDPRLTEEHRDLIGRMIEDGSFTRLKSKFSKGAMQTFAVRIIDGVVDNLGKLREKLAKSRE